MLGIIRSELLKMRHSFSMKLVILAPLVTLLLGYLLSGSYVQLSAYNWWYSMILPLVVSLCSASMIVREKKTGMQNIVCLPIRFDKIWLGKTAAFVILLFVSNLLLWISTTAVGFVTKVTVSPLDGLIGCMLLFLTYIWQIPFIMLLVNFMGYIPTVLVSLAANMILSAVGAEAKWFLFVCCGIHSKKTRRKNSLRKFCRCERSESYNTNSLLTGTSKTPTIRSVGSWTMKRPRWSDTFTA